RREPSTTFFPYTTLFRSRGSIHDRAAQRVLRVAFERRRKRQHGVLVPIERHDAGDARRAGGQRAGLVERDGIDLRDPLQRRATLDRKSTRLNSSHEKTSY